MKFGHLDPTATAANEAEFDTEDPEALAEVEKNILIQNWVDNIPSSPSEITLSDRDGSISSFQIRIGQAKSLNLDDAISTKDLILGNKSLKYTHNPLPRMTSTVMEDLLTYANERVPDINRKIASHPNYRPFFKIRGSAVWKLRRKSMQEGRSSWNPHRLFSWIKTLSIFQWFSKNVEKESGSNVDTNQSSIESPSLACGARITGEEETVRFVPYKSRSTLDGHVFPVNRAFGGDNIQDEVKAAVSAISSKLKYLEHLEVPQISNLNISEQVEINGFSDGEVLIQSQNTSQLDPLNTPSIQEIQRLTTLLQEKRKPSKMKSIFGMREFIRTDPHPSLLMIRREHHSPSALRRVFDRVASIFWNQTFRRRHRRLRNRRRPDFNPPELDLQQELDMNQLFGQPPLQAQVEEGPNVPQSTQNSFMRHVTSGIRGFMRLIGIRRDERVFPEILQPPLSQEALSVAPTPPVIVRNTRQSGINRIRGRRGDSAIPTSSVHISNGELRTILPSRGTIRRANPLRRRLLAEEYPFTIEPQDTNFTDGVDGDAIIVDASSTNP